MNIIQKIAELGYTLPPPAPPVGLYVPVQHYRAGNSIILSVSGQLSRDQDSVIVGKVGDTLAINEAQRAARLALLSALSIIEAEAGLNTIAGIVYMRGYVNCTADFTQHPQVIDAASEVLLNIFGSKGMHARVAVGVQSLPANAAVEIELTARALPAPSARPATRSNTGSDIA